MKFLVLIIHVIFCLILHFEGICQKDIRINGIRFNQLDKHKRKQGNWIFFDANGNIKMTTYYENDFSVTPLIYYQNTDTSFVKFPRIEDRQKFILFKADQLILGYYVFVDDSSFAVEIEPNIILPSEILQEIYRYQQLSIPPVYMFAQSKLGDYVSGAIYSSGISFNKPLYVELEITASGTVREVLFPHQNNILSSTEETELRHIYGTMPRWQPMFKADKAVPCKIIITNGGKISFL